MNILCPQRAINKLFAPQDIEGCERHFAGNITAIDQCLQTGVIVYLAGKDAFLHQVQETIHHHFTTAIKPLLEGAGATVLANDGEMLINLEMVKHLPPGLIVTVSENGTVDQGRAQ